MDFDHHDVVIAPFPFTDLPISKARPVLVLSPLRFHRTHEHLVGAMITSAASSHWPSDHPIADFVSAGLSGPALVRWKVFTLPLALVSRRIGALSAGDRAAIALKAADILLA